MASFIFSAQVPTLIYPTTSFASEVVVSSTNANANNLLEFAHYFDFFSNCFSNFPLTVQSSCPTYIGVAPPIFMMLVSL